MRRLGIRVLPLTLAALLLASAAHATPPDLVTTCGDEFVRDGRAYRFVGMNIRGLVHYGGGDGALPYTSLSHIDENLAGAANMGCRVIRVFAANRNLTNQQAVDRLGYALDRADAYGLKLIIALTDFYPTPFHPAGDDGYYTPNPWGWTVLNHAWFAGGYEQNYTPYVTLAVSTYKNHPAVFAWQLGNEIADQTSADTHDAFVAAMAAHIKSIDPDHMVSIGMLSLAHIPGYTTQRGVTLYSNPNLDFITAHRYNSDDQAIDFAVRDSVGKPLVVSEAGCDTNVVGDRVSFTNGRIAYFVDTRGARGYMNWGYQAQSFDIGDGDNVYGIDRYAHRDYNALTALYAGYATTLNAYEPLIDAPAGPRGRNLARDAVARQTDSDYGPEYTGAAALDGDLATKWTSTGTAPTHWLAVDLGQTWDLTGFRVQMAGAGGEWEVFNLAQFQLQTGPALSGPWTTQYTADNSGQADTLTFTLTTPVSAACARLYITDSGIDDYARLPEFEVIGDPGPLGDIDGDEDADLCDYVLFQRCFGGAGNPPACDTCDCAAANLTTECGDPVGGDVDLADSATFEQWMTAPY